MTKNYTFHPKTSKETLASPKESVIDQLLNYSKSLEVIALPKAKKEEPKSVELILN